jgi:phosphoribosylglycinamide formyltransferase-1
MEVVAVFSDRKEAGVHAKASEADVPSVYVPPKRRKAPGGLLAEIQQYRPDLLVLAGYLRLVPADVLAAFPKRVVNIHPALLPRFGGAGMYGMFVHEAVKSSGETQTGITIHLADEEYDRGRILFQATADLLPTDDAKTIAEKVLSLEHRHYPPVIEAYLTSLSPT